MADDRRAAFDLFVVAGSTRLLRAAYLLTGDWGHAEDLLQTALAKTWLRWNRIEAEQAAEAYTRKVMLTTYAKWHRRRWRGESPTEQLPDACGPDLYAVVDERDELMRSLATLPPRTRAVVVLRFFEDMSESQIAATLDCSVGTVKSTLSRGLARLRTAGSPPPEVPVPPFPVADEEGVA
jgi:RNA polymerase sigma-70 factor (sigma-E family)